MENSHVSVTPSMSAPRHVAVSTAVVPQDESQYAMHVSVTPSMSAPRHVAVSTAGVPLDESRYAMHVSAKWFSGVMFAVVSPVRVDIVVS